jgi:hypothetical protein
LIFASLLCIALSIRSHIFYLTTGKGKGGKGGTKEITILVEKEGNSDNENLQAEEDIVNSTSAEVTRGAC